MVSMWTSRPALVLIVACLVEACSNEPKRPPNAGSGGTMTSVGGVSTGSGAGSNGGAGRGVGDAGRTGPLTDNVDASLPPKSLLPDASTRSLLPPGMPGTPMASDASARP